MNFKYNRITPLVFQTLSWLPTRLFFMLLGTYKIEGKKELSNIKNKNVIFASNHSSEWDPVLLATALIGTKFSPLFFVSDRKYTKSGLRNLIYGGRFFKLMGSYPLLNADKDYKKTLQHHINILKLDRNLSIFPEGKKMNRGEISEAKRGVAFLAHTANIPVVPVGISGIYDMKFSNMLYRRRKLVIHFGKPLYLKDIFGKEIDINFEDYKDGADIIMKNITALIK